MGTATPDKLIAVTHRALSARPFLEQIERIAALKPCALILREKDLAPDAYETLGRKALEICEGYEVPCFLHGAYLHSAERLSHQLVHMPFSQLSMLAETPGKLDEYAEISVSCHSLPEVRRAQELGATRIVLGTIFRTDCKPGLEGAGLGFLREACAATSLPVFAIGGITPEQLPAVLDAGAAGACMMSWFMRA